MPAVLFEESSFVPLKIKKAHQKSSTSEEFSLPLNYPSWCKSSCSWPFLHCTWCLLLPSPRLTLFSHLPTFVTHSGGTNSPEVTAGFLLLLPHPVAPWIPAHAARQQQTCASVSGACLQKRLPKGGDCRGIDLASLGAFGNECLTLAAGKGENQTRFTSSTIFLLGMIS